MSMEDSAESKEVSAQHLFFLKTVSLIPVVVMGSGWESRNGTDPTAMVDGASGGC